MRFILLLAFLFPGILSLAQNYGNRGYALDQLKQIPGWDCGPRTFSVNADVMLCVAPDGWVIELQGTEEASTLSESRNKMQVRTDVLTKKLNALGIPSTDITVTTVSQERVMGWKPGPNGYSTYVPIAYSLTKSMLIHYSEASKYSLIVSEASLQEFDNVMQNYCTVADEQEAYAEVYRQAMEVALGKCDEEARFYQADVVPGWTVTREQYNVITPTPGVYVQPGAQRDSYAGYDRVLNGEYGSGAVKYTLHLEITFTLQKKSKPNPPNSNKPR